MVFYTLIFWFSRDLPYLLAHNIRNKFHLGDFVLSFFIFASGMSLYFFSVKYSSLIKIDLIKKILKKIFKLFIVWILISNFSSSFLAVDEIMLNILLFIPCILLAKANNNILLFIIFLILGINTFIYDTNYFELITKSYLGGYRGAIFWFPLMLSGILLAKNLNNSKKYLFLFSILTCFLIYFIPPYKMSLSPSFFSLSIATSILVFEMTKNLNAKFLIYLGKTPLRYWILMFFVFIIPIRIYGVLSQKTNLRLTFDYKYGVLLTIFSLIVLFLISKIIDKIKKNRSINPARV